MFEAAGRWELGEFSHYAGNSVYYFLRFGQQSACFLGGGDGQEGTLLPPIKPAVCQVSTQDVFLQHPILNTLEINGNRKEVSVNVACSRSSSINLRMMGLSNMGRLNLAPDGSVYSALTINNTPAHKNTTINNVGTSGVNVTIASVLGSNGEVFSSKYSASAVLMVDVL